MVLWKDQSFMWAYYYLCDKSSQLSPLLGQGPVHCMIHVPTRGPDGQRVEYKKKGILLQ